jgi:translocation and assembly module TamB
MDEATRSEATPAPRRCRPRALTVTAVTALALLVLLIAIASVLTWSVRTERGNAWLLSLLRGVEITAPKGTLIGDFDAQRIVIHLPGSSDTVTLDGVRWRGLHIERAAAPLWVRIGIDSLTVRRIDVAIAASKNAEPLNAPADLRLPIELDLRALRIGELHANALGEQPLRDLAARVHLSAGGGTEHRIDDLAFGWDRLQARASARIASAAPMPLRAVVGLAQQGSDALPAWSASAALAGPLAAPMLQATLRAAASVDRPGRPEQSLDVRAALRPFATWPLGELQASASALDLSAFASAAPATALTLQASATSTAADQPASLRIEASNALAGRWNEGRLPLRRLRLELAARPDQPSAVELRRLDAELGTAQANAGRVQGTGRWAPERWNLAATLAAVQPALLDARAPAMPLSGPLALASDPSASGTVSAKAELAGLLAERGNSRAVRLRLDASASPQRIDLRELQATAGGARASLSGLVTHAAADAPWAVKAQAELVDFDPALWWPGGDDSPWRKANHRLNATGRTDLTLPASAAQRPLLDQLAALRGEATLAIGKSVLAGVPISGEATLRSAAGAQAIATLQLDADGNRARAEGRLSTTGNGAADAWDVTLDGPALARLAPVFKLIQPTGADATLAGSLSASAHVSGRWPALSTQGQLEANALRAGAVSVQKAQARWTIGTSAAAPVEAQVTLTQVALTPTGAPGPSLESLQLQLAGTGRAHTLELRAESKARPPAWAEAAQSAAAPPSSAAATARTLAVLQAQGGLIDTPAAGWRGVISQLELRSGTTTTAPLLRTRDVTLEALWSGGPLRATLQPGRAELLGGAVRWSRIAWQAASAPGSYAQIEAEADIEPLRIAPLLARAQPDFGWGGDLSVAGHIKLKSAPTFSADIVIERSAGDLTVTDELGTLALGLTDMRLGLAADNGTWNFVQGLAGKSLGVLAGAVVARTSPTATWPAPETPIEGVLELRVADLGTWGTWVPPGWRLGGAMHASASIGGRLNGPEFTGELDGTQLSVRNFLQGVNVSDGDVAIALRGNTARIERFTAKAGSGSIRLEGNASLGDAPKATLQLNADKFQLLGRVDRRIVASGAGQLQLDLRRLAFDGRFTVDEGLIDFTRSDAPALSSDVDVVRAKGVASPAAAASAAASPATSTASTEREVALDLRVGLGEQLRVKGRGLDTGLRGELRITSPGGRLAVNGTVSAIDGTYAAYGQKLSIDRGLIAFSGAVENPRLDIEATRPNIDTRVGVIISGSAANPRVRLFSEPELSEIDKLSWLVMGRASDGLGRTETALLQRAALALLAGEGSGPTDQITKALGLDEISVRQSDGEVRETVIALGKQLSRRWYVGYERGLNATTGSFQLIYRIAQRFTLRAQSGEENSLDLIWTWRWN